MQAVFVISETFLFNLPSASAFSPFLQFPRPPVNLCGETNKLAVLVSVNLSTANGMDKFDADNTLVTGHLCLFLAIQVLA